MDEREIREENRRIRFLRMLVDLSLVTIQGGDLSLDQARKVAEEVRQAACNLFPGKQEAFDLIYQPRFNRAIHEAFGRVSDLQIAEEVVSPRMLKNAQMQGSRNPEE
jgi:hypothetical protein